MAKYKKNNRNKKILLIVVLTLLLAVIGYFVYPKVTTKDNNDTGDKTTSTAPSAQENFTSGGDRPIATTPENRGDAAIADNQGQQTSVPDKSQWSTSKTGEITLYAPYKDKLLVNGDSIAGESTLTVVYYRVIDDVSGMISQGQLSVINGKFSGVISFSTTAKSGRIDVYGMADSGKEYGNIEVPVRFK